MFGESTTNKITVGFSVEKNMHKKQKQIEFCPKTGGLHSLLLKNKWTNVVPRLLVML